MSIHTQNHLANVSEISVICLSSESLTKPILGQWLVHMIGDSHLQWGVLAGTKFYREEWDSKPLGEFLLLY